MNTQSGSFRAHDELGNSITLEWEKIAGKTEQLSVKIKNMAEILIPAYTITELDFARKKPEAIANDFMLKN